MFNLLAQVDLAHAVSSTVSDSGIDLNQIAQLSNGNPMVMLALGAVGILGGKKAWDWLKQRQEQQHEEKLAQIEASKIPVGTGHEQCVAKQEALESQVSAIKGKVGEISNKASDAQKKFDEVIAHANENFATISEDVKKLKKKVKKIQEEVEEQEKERARNKKKRKVDDDE